MSDLPGVAAVGLWNAGQASYAISDAIANPDKVLFEIGSITKVFTGLLVAQAVESGALSIDDSIEKLMAGHAVVSRTVAPVTLRQLLTHSACFPAMPSDFGANVTFDKEWAAYDRAKLWAALKDLQLQSTPPCKAAYSNFGIAVVGELLAQRDKKAWAQLVNERILQPLGMTDTIVSQPEKEPRLAPSFSAYAPAPSLHFNAFASTGGLRSTAADLLIFAER